MGTHEGVPETEKGWVLNSYTNLCGDKKPLMIQKIEDRRLTSLCRIHKSATRSRPILLKVSSRIRAH